MNEPMTEEQVRAYIAAGLWCECGTASWVHAEPLDESGDYAIQPVHIVRNAEGEPETLIPCPTRCKRLCGPDGVFSKRGDPTYRAKCACGWKGTPKTTAGRASLAGAAHVRFARPFQYGHGVHIEKGA